MTIKATGAVTSSVANTAKRVIVLLYMAAITGKPLTDEQKIGATVAIGGARGGAAALGARRAVLAEAVPRRSPAQVLLYSVIDDLFKGKAKKA